MHMVSELARWPVSQDTLFGYTWSLTEGRELVRADMAGDNTPGADMSGANIAGARSHQARPASVRHTDGISGSEFLRM